MDIGAVSYRRYLEGDDAGFETLIREYKDGLMLYLRGITGSIDTAEEMMEETFVRIAIKKPKFNEKSSFKTWLYSIGHNVTIDHLRKHAKISATEIEDLDLQADVESLENTVIREERKIMLHKALNHLNSDYRQVLQLSFFEEMKNEEIAIIMRKNKRQIENLLYRAKNALKEEMLKGGFTYEEL